MSEYSSNNPPKVIGRFAPSPTGPLHFGSLVAATASYLTARQNKQSKWLLRIEDLDSQRSSKHSTSSIIHTLEQYGFKWDGDIIYQSDRDQYYQAALDRLKQYTYPCSCTRKFLKENQNTNNKFSYIYPEFCRETLTLPNSTNNTTRIKTKNESICFTDSIQGEYCQNLRQEVGDFILRRADQSFAYQLAVIVDDEAQGVNQVIRGADLIDNTPRQIYLQQTLGFSTPTYGHIPVAVTPNGKKLSKQNSAPEVSKSQIRDELLKALAFLGQTTLEVDDFSNIDDIWLYAVQNWDLSKIPNTLTQKL